MIEQYSHSFKINKERVKEIYHYECAVCGSKNNLTVHHVVPKRNNGMGDKANLVALCLPCHVELEKLYKSKE